MNISSVHTAIIATAISLLGVPYKYGALVSQAPAVFDCSGFIQYCFAQNGIALPRCTIDQAGQGVAVELATIQPADLLFYRSTQGHYNQQFPEGIGHVALYVGDGKVINAKSRRVGNNPTLEEGKVEYDTLDGLLEKEVALVCIKRII